MEQDKSLQINDPKAIQTPQENVISPSLDPTGHIPLPKPTPKKSFLKSPSFWIVIIILFAFAGAYYFIYQTLENKVSQFTNEKKPANASVSPTRIPSIAEEINGTVLHSPDKKLTVRYYFKGEHGGEGDPNFTDVAISDMTTGKVTTSELSGAITWPSVEILFWNPINNRIYFTHEANGIGIYALWSSKPDGTDATLVSGQADKPPYLSESARVNSAAWGAENSQSISLSPDGKTIAIARQRSLLNNKSPLWLMTYDGSDSRPIPLKGNLPEYITSLKWAQEGKSLIYNSDTNNVQETYQIDITGGTPTIVK